MSSAPAHPDRRAAVVTGASSGIGAATASALAAIGHPVVLGARRVERCEAIAAAIREAGGEAVAVPLDLHSADSVSEFALRAVAELGPIEIVISNAGNVLPVTTVDADPEAFTREVEVNLLGPQRVVRHLVPAMVERQRGDVVFVTSDAALSPRPCMSPYVASKSGLEGMARAMRMELEGTGVRVGIVRPGPSLTEQGSTWDPADIDTVLSLWTRWGFMRHHGYLDASDVAAAIVAMVSVRRGAQLAVIEVQPEAPVRPAPTHDGGPS